MTIIEARYVGPQEVPERPWFTWQRYDLAYYANKALRRLQNQFAGLYEFRLVEP